MSPELVELSRVELLKDEGSEAIYLNSPLCKRGARGDFNCHRDPVGAEPCPEPPELVEGRRDCSAHLAERDQVI
jgi:hypothetical protein